MTTATTIPESCTVTATVEGKEEVENGILLRLTIPQFKSKFPVPVRVTSDVASTLKVAQSLAVALIREKLKADKTGTYHSDYYWGWASKQPDPRQVEAVTPGPKSRPAELAITLKDLSIERQKALDLAGRDYWEYCRVKGWAPESLSHAAAEISGLACAYAKWTIGQGKPVPLVERMPDGVPEDPAVALGLADAEAVPTPAKPAQAATAPQTPTFASFADQLRHYGLSLNDVAACLPEGVAWDKATREQRKVAFTRAVEVKDGK